MEYSKARKGQLVLVTYHAQKGKDKDKLIDVFVGEVKSKIRGSRTLIRVKNLQKGLGYDPKLRSYVGCQVEHGWFKGKPINIPGKILEDHDQYHHKELEPLNAIMNASKKLHQIAPGVKANRVYTYRPLAYKLTGDCHVEFACINTQDMNINGILVRLHSIDRKKSSDWVWCSCFCDHKQVEEFLLQHKKKFLAKAKPKRTRKKKK